MSSAKIVFLPTRNKYGISKTLEATEIFELMMLNMFDDDYEKIVTRYINNDNRELSELSIWLLRKRGFSEYSIPKMRIELEVPVNETCYA